GGGGEGGAVDGEGVLGEVGGAGEAVGDGEDDGAAGVLEERLGGGDAGLVEDGAHAGGEAAEGVGEARGERGDLIEGEDPVVADEVGEAAGGGGGGGEGGGGGIDEGAEDAGGGGLAGGAAAAEDEDRE